VLHAFFGVFAKSRKALVTFIMSVRSFIRTFQRGSHWTDLREVLFWGLPLLNLSGKTGCCKIGQKYRTLYIQTSVYLLLSE
jgi:hypothetical protein